MNYYFIRQPSDKKIVGINDGGVQAEIVESRWQNKEELKRYINEYILGVRHVVEMLENGEEVQPPRLEYIKVRPKAILTDFLSFSEGYPGGRFLVSGKVKKIIEDHNAKSKFYGDLGLYHQDKKIDNYFNLHLLPLKAQSSFVFERSIFFNGLKLAGKTLRYAESYEEFKKLQKEGKLLNIELLVLKSSEIGSLDIFTFDEHAKIYVSERLARAFQLSGVTGISYHEPEEPRLEIV